jgi:hypothetical protein
MHICADRYSILKISYPHPLKSTSRDDELEKCMIQVCKVVTTAWHVVWLRKEKWRSSVCKLTQPLNSQRRK